MEPLKVIYCGTPDFATVPLEKLLADARFVVEAVVTQPDQPVGRKKKMTPPPVKTVAKLNNLFVLQPEKIASEKEKIEGLKPDFMVVVAYGQLIPKEILAIPKFGCINIHFSLLPRYRGASPVQESLLHADSKTGVTFMMMEQKLDSGPILEQIELDSEKDDTTETLLKKLTEIAAQELPRILLDLAEGKIKAKPQDDAKATYCRKITKANGLFDPAHETATEMVNKIRAYTPWPGCFIFLSGKRLKITKAECNEQKNDPGKWILIDDMLALGTKKGTFVPLQVQLEGKKEVPTKEFLKGNKVLFGLK